MSLGFVRQFPHDLSRLLNPLHAVHRFAGPERHRVELPRRGLVGDERGARLYGNADPRSPRLYGLADELSLEPLDRFHAGPQDAMGRIRPVRGEGLGEDRVLRLGGDELVDVHGMGSRLFRGDEPGAHSDRRGARREGRRHGPPGADPAGRDDRHLDQGEDLAEERQEADLPPDMATRLGSLGHDQVAARPLRGYGLGRGTELPGDEGAPRVGDLHEFRVGLLVEELDHRGPGGRALQDLQEVGVELAGLAHPVDDEVRAERAGRRATQAVEDLCDVFRRGRADPADHSEAPGVRDRRRQGRRGDLAHPRLLERHCTAEQFREFCLEHRDPSLTRRIPSPRLSVSVRRGHDGTLRIDRGRASKGQAIKEDQLDLSRGGAQGASGTAQNATRPVAAPDEELKSNEFLFDLVEAYISKVTAAGQLTLPKKIRKALGLKERDYVEVALVGRTAIIRRLREDEEFLDSITRKVKKTGLTRARLEQILHEVKKESWKKRYREAVR